MPSKCDFANTANRTESFSVTRTGRPLLPIRLLKEIVNRFRLALCAPTIEQSAKNVRERRYAESQRLAEEYAQGYLEGWHECYSACVQIVEESVSDKHDIWAVENILGASQDLRTN